MPDKVKDAVWRWESSGRPCQGAVSWPREAWTEALPEHGDTFRELPEFLDRETVEAYVRGAPQTESGSISAFLAAMAWGYGTIGYGPHRVAKIAAEAPAMGADLLAATVALRAEGPGAGYHALATTNRMKHLGPAFGTKFLFFQSRGDDRALILDQVVSDWLRDQCGIVRKPDRWSAQIYAAYIDDMRDWSKACGVSPSTLEMILFMSQTRGTGGQWDSEVVSDARALVTRPGDPNEYDLDLEPGIAEPDEIEELEIPAGLFRQLLADPVHAPETLAAHAVAQFAVRAERDVRLLRERNPDATDRQLAVHFKRKYSRMARWEGAGTGVAGILAVPADLVLLTWIQDRLVLSIAASYGHDMADHTDRAAELLAIQGVHNSRELARRALNDWAQRSAKKLVLRHLRKQPLTLAKQLFRVVGIKFTRKALLEKGVPLLAVPLSAGVNEVSTRLLANQAITFYDTEVGS